jgi:hypothetical protein
MHVATRRPDEAVVIFGPILTTRVAAVNGAVVREQFLAGARPHARPAGPPLVAAR